MLRACEKRPPIFCGIDISSDSSKCAIAIGEASFGAAGSPTLTVSLREPNEQGENDWNLPSVAGVIAELVAQCKSQRRKAVVAVDIPFGYPKAFASYVAQNPLQSKSHTDRLPLVDSLVYRGCEKKLKRTLLAPESWTTATSRLPLWQHYQSLRTAFFSEDDPNRMAKRKKDQSVKASSCFPTSPLCTVADKIGRAVARWIRVACELDARSVGPSLWTIGDDVYLFECYPLASLVASGLWHPNLKGKERGGTTRAAAVGMLQSQKISLTDAGGKSVECNFGAFWGNVQVGNVTGSDHTFDALVCACTAWWCGESVLSGNGVVGFESYPKPPLAEVSDQCFTDDEGNALDIGEGGIYYPKTPECLWGP